MSDTKRDPVADAIAAICSDVDESQVDDTQYKPFGSGFELDFRIENVDREEGGVFSLVLEESDSHVTGSDDDNDTVTEVWGRMMLDGDEMTAEGLEAWAIFTPRGYEGPLHLVYHMNHYAGEYSDDESDSNANVTMYVVGDGDLDAAIAAAKALWRNKIGGSAITKITDALSDVALLEEKELLLIADLPAFAEINRRVASVIR